MTGHRWHWLPISLVIGGVVLVCAAAAINFRALGWWELLIFAGCALAVAAAFWFRHKLSAVEIELEALRKRLADDETRLNTQRSEFEQLRVTIQSELAQEAVRLDKREQNLTQRLVTYREWMEFPQPLEMASPAAPSAELSDLARKDRQMLELLQAETKLLYDNILQNKYASGDQVLLPVIRDDALVLITKVARIYQPGIEHPFIDASLARILRATSRASLQMLVDPRRAAAEREGRQPDHALQLCPPGGQRLADLQIDRTLLAVRQRRLLRQPLRLGGQSDLARRVVVCQHARHARGPGHRSARHQPAGAGGAQQRRPRHRLRSGGHLWRRLPPSRRELDLCRRADRAAQPVSPLARQPGACPPRSRHAAAPQRIRPHVPLPVPRRPQKCRAGPVSRC